MFYLIVRETSDDSMVGPGIYFDRSEDRERFCEQLMRIEPNMHATWFADRQGPPWDGSSAMEYLLKFKYGDQV